LPHVLLIDDNPVQLHIREAVLRDAGLEVRVANTAARALEILRDGTEHGELGAVVTDHVMPETSGSELVTELRKVNPTVPVIVVSGLPEAEPEYEGLNVVFRQKPFPPPELIALVRQALNA